MNFYLNSFSSGAINKSSEDGVFKIPVLKRNTRERKRKIIPEAESPAPNKPPNKRGRPKGFSPKKAQNKTGLNVPENLQDDSLFTQLKGCRNLHPIIDKWIRVYDDSPEVGTVQLLQLLITSSGCLGKIDINMIRTMELKPIADWLSEQFDLNASDYPLAQGGATWKKFRSNLGDFITLLVMKCRSGIIFDSHLMNDMIHLLSELSDSHIRAFRHTSTFLATKLSSAIVDAVVELVRLREKNTMQVETERAKLRNNATNEILDMLLSARAEYDYKIDELSSMIQYIFRSIFVHRYRDVIGDIRCICIKELGNWMIVYPALFLDDSYLKYIGWSLHDKMFDVRLQCLNILIHLYDTTDTVEKLELFTSKFKERLVTLVKDKEIDVCIKACQLMLRIYRAFPTLLDKEDSLIVYESIYSTNRALALAAAEFVNIQLFSNPRTANHSESLHQESKQTLIDLISFFNDGSLHKSTAYLVDALLEINSSLKDWPVYIEMLLSNETDSYDNILISIMSAAVKESATGQYPPCRIQNRRGMNASLKDPRILYDERVRITEAFIPFLPKLLSKFIADPAKIVEISSIFVHFQLNLYLSTRQEMHLNELLHIIQRILEQHSDDDVLVNIAAILTYMESADLSIAQITEATRLRILDGLGIQFQQSMDRFDKETGSLDEDDQAALLSACRKISAFSASVDLNKWKIWENSLKLLANSGKFQSSDLAEKGIMLLFNLTLWDIKKMNFDSLDEEVFERLRMRLTQFMTGVKHIICFAAVGVEMAYRCLCDILLLMNPNLTKQFPQNENVRSLIITVDRDFALRISQFVVDNVFVKDEGAIIKDLPEHSKIQLMFKRRFILSQYAKLIMYGVLPISDASQIFRYYLTFYNDYGDVIKLLLQKCREIDRILCAKTIVLSLVMLYRELKNNAENGFVDPNSDEFTNLKELAKRFALSFGVDTVRIREPIAVIHKEGISFAFDHDEQKRIKRRVQRSVNINFLEVIMEFSSKLIRQDKVSLLRYLEKNNPLPPNTPIDDTLMQSYMLYRNSLQHKLT